VAEDQAAGRRRRRESKHRSGTNVKEEIIVWDVKAIERTQQRKSEKKKRCKKVKEPKKARRKLNK